MGVTLSWQSLRATIHDPFFPRRLAPGARKRGSVIGHGSNTDPNPKKDYSAALTAAQTKTPGQIALENASAQTLNWAQRHDYRDPSSGGLFVNYADPSRNFENLNLRMNEGGQGITALGTADPNYLKAVHENTMAHAAEDAAGQYEHDIKEGVGQAAIAAGDAEHSDLARDMGVLRTTEDVYQANANKPKWWQYALQAGAGALTKI